MIRIALVVIAFGALAAWSSAISPPGPAATGGKPPADAPETKCPKESCIQPAMACANECLSCMKHCREGKMESLAKECEICHHACLMCALAVQEKTPTACAACEVCEKICNDCAANCEKNTDPAMKKCMEACRACAKACADSRK